MSPGDPSDQCMCRAKAICKAGVSCDLQESGSKDNVNLESEEITEEPILYCHGTCKEALFSVTNEIFCFKRVVPETHSERIAPGPLLFLVLEPESIGLYRRKGMQIIAW